jgi:NADPH:quinone reductase-like Zn-dependent oxidoreductase
VRAAGIREIGDPVMLLELPGPRALRPDEVLIDARACGIGNWDEIARQGGWDLGTRPPMALGVEAAGLAAAVGAQVADVEAGDRVTAHSLPLREQGAWAERYIAAAEHVAVVPAGVAFDAAGALPVPALTADQTIGDALGVRVGETILVHGAGGVDAAANAVPAGSIQALRAVRDRGRLATITSDPPAPERDITVREVYVAPDGRRLSRLVQLLAQGVLTVLIGERFPLEQGAAALARVGHGAPGSAVVLEP